MSATDAPDEAGGTSRPLVRAWQLAVVVALVAAGLLLAVPDAGVAHAPGGPWTAALVFAALVLAEPLVFHVEARNEAVSHSPSDVPLALGVVLLPPPVLLLVRVVASGLGLVIWRRPPPFKLALNLASFALEAVVAVLVFRLLVTPGSVVGLVTWLALTLAMGSGLLVGGSVIATAISFFEGDVVQRLLRELRQAHLYYLPGATLAASIAVAYLVEGWLLWVFLVLAGIIWLLLRSHGSLHHQFSDLTRIHAFSSHVGRSANLGDIAETAVREIAGHLRATTVGLVVRTPLGGEERAGVGDRELMRALPSDLEAPLGEQASGEPFRLDGRAHPELHAAVAAIGHQTGVAVGLGEPGERGGLLVATGRLGATHEFDDNDLQRLEALAQQLTVAMRNGQLHMEIQHRALHDELTGLPNRGYFDSWMARHLGDGGRGPACVLMIDLDRFKEVNDTLGHQAGDDLLRIVTSRLDELMPGDGMLARLGGDEFAIFLPGTEAERAEALAEAASVALETPVALDGTTVGIGGSIGIAVSPEDGTDAETLMRRADVTMYEAKRSHVRWLRYTADLEGDDHSRLELLGELRQAIANRGLGVVFQPKVDLRTGAVVGAEALARWTSPTHGPVSPDVFISLAEQVGLIDRLTQVVLDVSLEAAARWQVTSPEVDVAVNVSAQCLLSDEFVGVVREALAVHGVPATSLTLEITERAMLGDSQRTIDVLDALAADGVRFSVDDFGTGYSSMANLRHLPIRELKIDRSFVTEMLVGRTDEVIVRSAAALGRSLGLVVVAEGVESPNVEARVRDAGCEVGQGFGIARPMPAMAFERFLQLREEAA